MIAWCHRFPASEQPRHIDAGSCSVGKQYNGRQIKGCRKWKALFEETLKQGVGFFAFFFGSWHTDGRSLKIGVGIGFVQGF